MTHGSSRVSALQYPSITFNLQEVTLVHFRLLVLNEFGSEDPFAVADKAASLTRVVGEMGHEIQGFQLLPSTWQDLTSSNEEIICFKTKTIWF